MSDVLPGVAIAISLVPPLAVVGVCLGQGEFAFGAAVLFASNVLSLVLAGTLVFTAYRYAEESSAVHRGHRFGYLTMTAVFVALLLPLGANTAANLLVSTWTQRITTAATRWVAPVDGAEVTDVVVAARTAHIAVVTPQPLPPIEPLLTALHGQVPPGVRIVVTATYGRQVNEGTVG